MLMQIAFIIKPPDGVGLVYLFNHPRSVHSGPTVSVQKPKGEKVYSG